MNITTLEALLDTSLHSGRLIVYTENGISQTDSIVITRNTVSLSNNMNFLSATYSGDSLAANWTWYNCVNNDTVNTDSIGAFTVDQTGVYGVYVEENGCIVQSACVVVSEIFVPVDTSTTGIKEAINNNAISLYPNPSNGKITINATNNNAINTVNIFDITGTLVFTQVNLNKATANININHLNTGVYIVEVLSANNKSIVKLIIK